MTLIGSALSYAVDSLRLIRNEEESDELITLSSMDPLNLIGIILPGDKVAVNSKKIITLKNGVPVESGEHSQPLEHS